MAESRDLNAEHARNAASIEPDVTVEHIAAVYAEALLDAAEKAGQSREVIEEFDSLAADVLDAFPKLEAILASGLVAYEEKSGLIDRVFAARGSRLMVDFLKVVARHGRCDCLRAIHRQLHALDDRRRGRVPVTVITATAIDDSQIERIAAALGEKLGGEPVVACRTDPGLIGGVVVRVGDTVYDGSVANQLENIRKQMIDRSVHEIQSRRDRFRYPAGD
jgi:F-type H+-transporting ATPase subunit delta